jgi:hypothetical protein
MHPPGGSPAASAQSLSPRREENKPEPQPHNPCHRHVDVPLAQKTQAKTNRNHNKPSEAQLLALTGNTWPVIQRITNILSDRVPPLFLQISDSIEDDQLVQQANAKLEVVLKKNSLWTWAKLSVIHSQKSPRWRTEIWKILFHPSRSVQKFGKPHSASKTHEEKALQQPIQGLCAMAALAAEPLLEPRAITHASGHPLLSAWTGLVQRMWPWWPRSTRRL